MSRIFFLYKKHGKASGENILPLKSIEYYLENDKRYFGKTRVRFKFLDTTLGPTGEWKSKAEQAYCFDYDELNVSLDENTTDESTENTNSIKEQPAKPQTDEKLPF
ncbi:MAG: hypothetical protein NTV01_10805 [Bacteroidia bacterium]|nr:hypothetical protein [Bacteroidia bacterium]